MPCQYCVTFTLTVLYCYVQVAPLLPYNSCGKHLCLGKHLQSLLFQLKVVDGAKRLSLHACDLLTALFVLCAADVMHIQV